jgi:hypothetical protein
MLWRGGNGSAAVVRVRERGGGDVEGGMWQQGRAGAGEGLGAAGLWGREVGRDEGVGTIQIILSIIFEQGRENYLVV